VLRTKEGSALKKIQQTIARTTAKDDQFDCIRRAVELVFGFQAKPDQVESIWSLLVQKEDRILVAKTGYGKGVIPQLLPLLVKDSIVLILLPLNALGAEQFTDIAKLPLSQFGYMQEITTIRHLQGLRRASIRISFSHQRLPVA
jgi:hypothetical protein